MSQALRSVMRNSFFRAIIEGAKLLSGVILVIILARWLGPGEYGRLSFVLALMAFFSVGLNLGLPLTFVREGAKREEFLKENISTGLVMQAVAFVVLLGLLGLAVELFPKLRADTSILILGLVYTTLGVVANFFYSFFQAVQKMQLEALNVTVQNILTLIVVMVFIIWRGTVDMALWGYLIATALSVILAWFLTVKYLFTWKWRLDWPASQKLFKQAWPLMASLAFGGIYHSLDTVMLRFFRGDEIVGIYNAQYRVVYVFYVFGGWYVYSILPLLSSSFAKAKEQYKYLLDRSVQTMTAFAFIFGLGVTFFAQPIVTLLYGSSYLSGVLTLQIMIWPVVLSLVGAILYHALVAAEEQSQVMWSVAASTVAIIVLNILLIPTWGMVGAALSLIGAQIIQFVLNVKATKKIISFGLLPLVKKPAVYAVLSAIAYYAISLVAGPYPAGLAALALYILVLFKTKVLDGQDFKAMIMTLVRKSPPVEAPAK